MGKPGVPWRDGKASRIAACAVVVAVHAALGVYATLPVRPWRHLQRHVPDPSRMVMRVRLIDQAAAPTSSTIRLARPPVPAAPTAAAVHRPTAPAPDTSDIGSPVPRRVLDLELHDDHTPFRTAQGGSVVGGRHGDTMPNRSVQRLPGGAHQAGAPRIDMADPRILGAAGVARRIVGLFGAVDSHCVDVDTWRGMTPEERREKGIYDQDVERVATRHDCTPPKRETLQGGPRQGPLCPPWRCPKY